MDILETQFTASLVYNGKSMFGITVQFEEMLFNFFKTWTLSFRSFYEFCFFLKNRFVFFFFFYYFIYVVLSEKKNQNIGLVWGPWSLLHHHLWAFTFAGHPLAALCRGVPSVHRMTRHLVLQQVTDEVKVKQGQHITLDLGFGICRVDQSASSPLCLPLLHSLRGDHKRPPGDWFKKMQKQGLLWPAGISSAVARVGILPF